MRDPLNFGQAAVRPLNPSVQTLKTKILKPPQGEWSRLELMRDPLKFGQAAVRGFVATLPARAHSIYYKDVIGNISTSMVRPSLSATELILTPRYPLYGGWQVEFTLGFSLPLSVSPAANRLLASNRNNISKNNQHNTTQHNTT